MKIAKDFTELVGNTPLVRIKGFDNLVAKCEFMNPSNSIKDRVGVNMITQALKEGIIDSDTTIIEPTSGNTGIGLASTCASLGLKLILTMPETMSMERRKLLEFLGATLILTQNGMKGAIEKAQELLENTPNAYMPNQFENLANKEAHKKSTALEILQDCPNIDIFVAGVGTGGTVSGVGEVLKAIKVDAQIYAIEPNESPIISKNEAGAHKIQGIGAGFVPKILNQTILDGVITVTSEEALQSARDVAKRDGLLVGISSGANLYGAMKLAKENPDKMVVTILPDTGERYISTELF
jgi:cysteine synthase A